MASYLFVDNENPVITNCPSTQTADVASGSSTATVTWTEPTATDNSGTVTLDSDSNSGGSFSVGTTPVFYTATDPSGNTATCTFDVVVIGKGQ